VRTREVIEVNGRISVSAMLVLAMLIILSAVAPAVTAKPKLGYTSGSVGVPASTGREWTSDDGIMHARDAKVNHYYYGAPWGYGTGESIGVWNLNVNDWTGNGISHAVDTYAGGTIEGITNYQYIGFGDFIYAGPTFTYDGVTVSPGDKFRGLLLSGIGVKHGTSGALEGLQIRSTFTAVSIRVVYNPQQVPLLDKSVSTSAVTYWWTG
jgi:hypothetical protein